MTEDAMVRQWQRFAFHVASEFRLPNADIADVHQEALIGLLYAIRHHDPALSSFKTYAARCVRARLMDRVKTVTRAKRVPPSAIAYDALDALAAPGPDTADTAIANERFRDLIAGIKALHLPHRTALIRVVFCGEPIGTKASDNALYQARRKLAA